jgi:hypothetical protein
MKNLLLEILSWILLPPFLLVLGVWIVADSFTQAVQYLLLLIGRLILHCRGLD